jgi:hypothetical protein
MDKDTEIARLKVLCKQYKAAAEKWEREYKIVEKRSLNLGDALYILTAQRSAHLNWLYRLGDFNVSIPEVRQRIHESKSAISSMMHWHTRTVGELEERMRRGTKVGPQHR